MAQPTLNGKRAVKVNAEKILWSNTDKAAKYRIDGDEEWVPHSQSKFTPEGDTAKNRRGDIPGTLLISEWFYTKLFPNG